MQWVTDLLKKHGELQIAREAGHLEDNLRVLRNDRASVRAHHRRHFGEDYQPSESEDVIHIGDQTVQRTGSKALAIALGVGLSALGGGLGTAGVMIANALKSTAPQSAAPAPPTSDADTQFELRLGRRP